MLRLGVKLGLPCAKNARIVYAVSALGKVMTCGFAPICNVPLVAVLAGVATAVRPIVARALVRFIQF